MTNMPYHLARQNIPLQTAPTPHHLRRFIYHVDGVDYIFDETETSLRFQLPEPEIDAQSSTNKRTSQIGGPPPKRRGLDDGEEYEDVDPQFVSIDQGESSSEVQPSLLSPNASPRSESSETASPTPPSARAYVPSDTWLDEIGANMREPSQHSLSTIVPQMAGTAIPLPLSLPISLPNSIRLTQRHHTNNQHNNNQHNTHDQNNNTNNNMIQSKAELNETLRLIGENFAKLPQALHNYTMYSLMRACSRQTLSFVYQEAESALKLDFLQSLPPELSKMVLCQLDIKSACSASMVCRRWYEMIDQDEEVWQSLIANAGLPLEPQDITHAKVERWGYHGWSTLFNRGTVPVNCFGTPANPYKAVFRRLEIIRQNWFRKSLPPRRTIIKSPDKEVITCLDYSDGVIIACTDDKHHLNVYDARRGTLMHSFNSHDGGVWALKKVSPDIIVTGSIDHTVRVWSLSKNRCTHVFRGHNATVRSLDVVMPDKATNRDYPVILSGSRDATVRMLRLPDAEDEDYDSLAALSDADNPYFLAELRGHTDSVRSLCGDGDIAVTGSYDFKVRVWEISNKRCRHELRGHENKVYSVALDTKRNRCISASMDLNIKIWDLDTGSELYNLSGHTGLVGLLKLRDDTLVSGAADFTLRVWDPETGQRRHTLKGHNSAILCFDHDGHRVVSGSVRDLKLWNAQTGEFVTDLLEDVDHIWQVGFDRKRCVAAVARGEKSHLEILDFDFDPAEREQEIKREKIHQSIKKEIDFITLSTRSLDELLHLLCEQRPELRDYLMSGDLNPLLIQDLKQDDEKNEDVEMAEHRMYIRRQRSTPRLQIPPREPGGEIREL